MYESGFLVLSDDLTIIGVQYDKDKSYNSKIIKKEKINDKTDSIMTYNGNSNCVDTLLVNQNEYSFMAGDIDDNVVKYNLRNGNVIKKFNNIGVDSVLKVSEMPSTMTLSILILSLNLIIFVKLSLVFLCFLMILLLLEFSMIKIIGLSLIHI